jgi:penicillin-binding protein 2
MKRKFFPGVLFGENIEKNKSRGSLPSKDSLDRANKWVERGLFELSSGPGVTKISKWRVVFVYIFFALALTALLVRSFELQVIEGDSFLGKAEDNRYKVRIAHAPRGVVYDRNGKVLARNTPAFNVVVDPNSLPEESKEEVVKKLSQILEISVPEIRDKLKEETGDSIVIKNNISHEVALNLETKELPGVEVEVNPRREYSYAEILAHLVGYTSEVSKAELENPHATPHQLGDRVGRAGVEKSFEDILRGANGYDLIKVDALGKKQGSLVTTNPIAGNDITLSIDIDLQKKVSTTLKKWLKNSGSRAGSVVVLNPYTGEVLALASYPSFDNNIFEEGLTQKKYSSLVEDKDKPLLNRAVGASYPPGSTFKLVTAAAGLESGGITPETRIVDTGFIKLGDQVFNNWLWLDHGKTEGAINVVRAIARSNDTFFFKLGQRVGERAIQDMAKKFSLGSITGINLPSETAGLVPTEQWKLDTKGEVWFPGETLNLAIGQGDLLVSPLQLSVGTSVYANGGSVIKPTVLKVDESEVIRSNFLSDQTINTVRAGMYQNTRGDGNVSYLFNSFKVKSAGKTGTAESGTKKPHAWYTAYAPYDKPEIVVTVMAEHAGHGSEVSAPATKEIFKWYFKVK